MSNGGDLGHVALDFDAGRAIAGLGDLVGCLHAKERVHFRTESFFDSQSHFGREGGSGVQQRGECRPGDAKNLRGLRYGGKGGKEGKGVGLDGADFF